MSSSVTSPPASTPSGLGRYRRHLPHLVKAKWQLVGGIASGVVFALCTGAGIPVALKYLLPIFFNRTDKLDPELLALYQRWLGDDYAARLMLLACLGLPLIFIIRGVAAVLNRYLTNEAGFIALESLRLEAFDRLLRLPLGFYQRNTAGDLLSRLLGDTEKLKTVVVGISSEIIKQPLTLLASSGFLVYLCVTERSVLFALIAMVSVPFCIVPIRLAAKRIVRRSLQLATEGGKLGTAAIETLQSPLEIQAYNLGARQRARFAEHTTAIFKLSLKTVKYQSIVTPLIEVVSVFGFIAALYFGTRQGMSYESFFALAAALYLSYEPVKKLSGIHGLVKSGEASLDRLEYILDAPDTVPAPAAPRPFPTGPLVLAFTQARFSYPPRAGEIASPSAGPALDGVTLQIAPGETVALVGKTGAGKSTFVTLIPRFYDVDAGCITLGGVDVRQLDKTALREHIALVPQQPLLFNTSLAENIRLGRPGASDAEVTHAARRAQIHDFITSLPEGYTTEVGERGNSLSGGQRQRIAIARAFLKDAPILILDEATSALDSESEAAIQDALRELVKGRTTFMIAHRFSSIRHATRILVFEQGGIVADGAHEEIYSTSPIYRELYDRQMLGARTT